MLTAWAAAAGFSCTRARTLCSKLHHVFAVHCCVSARKWWGLCPQVSQPIIIAARPYTHMCAKAHTGAHMSLVERPGCVQQQQQQQQVVLCFLHPPCDRCMQAAAQPPLFSSIAILNEVLSSGPVAGCRCGDSVEVCQLCKVLHVHLAMARICS